MKLLLSLFSYLDRLKTRLTSYHHHTVTLFQSVWTLSGCVRANFFYQCNFIMLDLLSSLLRITYPLRLPFSCSLMSDVKNLIITKCTKKISIEIKNTNKKWFLWISKGGKAHTLKYIFIWISINHPRMDEAPWCYKWIGWSWVGSRERLSKEHLTLIKMPSETDVAA